MNIKDKAKLRPVFVNHSEVDGNFCLTKQENCQDKLWEGDEVHYYHPSSSLSCAIKAFQRN